MIFTVLFRNILLFGALAIPGYLLGRLGKVTDGALAGITNILTAVAMPALVFSKLIVTDFSSLGTAAVVCCVLFPIGITYILHLLTVVLFRGKAGDGRTVESRFCAIFSNCGFLGIPLASVLFPNQPGVAAFVSLFNVFSTLMLLTLGVYVYSGDRRDICVRRVFFKPVTIAVLLGVVCSLAGIGDALPAVGIYADYLAALTTPLAMIVLGVQLSGLSVRRIFCNRGVYAVSAVKLLLSPLLTMGLLLLVRSAGVPIGMELAAALMISTGVSTAASAPAMAECCGADSGYATMLTLGTTMLCMISLPLISVLFDLVF